MVRNSSASNSNNENTFDDGQGLGPHLVGKQLEINGRTLSICKQIGEGGFSFVYLVKCTGNNNSAGSSNDRDEGGNTASSGPQHSSLGQQQQQQQQHSKRNNNRIPLPPHGTPLVLKITSVHTSAQRLMAEKEAKLLQTLSHPSIVQVYDHGFRDASGINEESYSNASGPDGILNASGGTSTNTNTESQHSHKSIYNRSLQHLILMEYCEGGTAFDTIKRMRAASGLCPTSSLNPSVPLPPNSKTRFDLPSLVIAFGQICNAVSYLHAQRPPIIHRDLKPVNFLIKNGAYKLCDFGSAVLGHTDLRTAENRRKAEEVVSKTTTQMFRAPEMVDLYMSKRLTQSTDVWALGCCLYSLAFLKDCFEEGSNLAILSRKYKIPDDNPYGEGIVDLIDRMLTVDYKERADMSEVIMCLSALYSNRELPKRKKRAVTEKAAKEGENSAKDVSGSSAFGKNNQETDTPRVGAYRTDGQGIRPIEKSSPLTKEKKVLEAKKLNPNSAAAKRKKASETNKQKESIITPSQLISSGTVGGGKSSSSTRSETPMSDAGNFASFDQVFEDNFDPFRNNDDGLVDLDSSMEKSSNNDRTFSSAFDGQCQIRSSSLQRSGTMNRSTSDGGRAQSGTMTGSSSDGDRAEGHDGNTSFEVVFQGFDSSVPSVFSTDDHYFAYGNNNRNDGFGERMVDQDELSKPIGSPSRKLFGFGVNNDVSAATMSGKKKRGMFGILGKR
ncbi:hypothetical protein HJC23_002778 [Cyclotella cryptica]|uniref:non-specific serine/threonine protein kinase n=1 Tax=Cyclotella cryptica TaxID=29204 RepID=A0ABD3PGC2_9STRA|eukprot:CCRYP_015019-RA/>CCRYP_015019-RA protein AED:0.11 eAED:0.11 QI:0/-1/0/1/-1/1/1/0/724